MRNSFYTAIFSFFAFFSTVQGEEATKLGNPVARIMEPQNLIDLLVTIFQFLGGPIVVIGLIYAGYTLVSAQGETSKLEEGRRALLWVIVGAAIILGATVLKDVVGGTIDELR
jgi:TRAP-type mannitol/chloroaromatic compound transport system permease small subunit